MNTIRYSYLLSLMVLYFMPVGINNSLLAEETNIKSYRSFTELPENVQKDIQLHFQQCIYYWIGYEDTSITGGKGLSSPDEQIECMRVLNRHYKNLYGVHDIIEKIRFDADESHSKKFTQGSILHAAAASYLDKKVAEYLIKKAANPDHKSAEELTAADLLDCRPLLDNYKENYKGYDWKNNELLMRYFESCMQLKPYLLSEQRKLGKYLAIRSRKEPLDY